MVTFDTASRNCDPFENVIKKYGIPNVSYLHCTRELKQRPIHHYVKKVIGWEEYKTAIGIRADEIDRISAEKDKLNYWYPLIKKGITKKDVNDFWENQSFNLQLLSWEGNCRWCHKKGLISLIRLCLKHDRPEWRIKMEEQYGNFTPSTRKNDGKIRRFYRKNISISDIYAAAIIIKDNCPYLYDKLMYGSEVSVIEVRAELIVIAPHLVKLLKIDKKERKIKSSNSCLEHCEPF